MERSTVGTESEFRISCFPFASSSKNKTSTDDTQDNTRFSSVDKFAKDVTKKIMSPGKKLMNLYNPIALAGSLGAGVKTESDIPKDIVEEVTRFKELIK
jgi:hypothetical protein